MHWRLDLQRLLAESPLSYGPREQPNSEATALAALALLGHGRRQAARRPLQWLAATQQADGRVPLRRDPPRPAWTTALAAAAWSAADRLGGGGYSAPLARAVDWMLRAEGESSPRHPQFGHDSAIVGWPWVLGTHSWLEPTALHVLALDAAGHAADPRCRQGRRLIGDRLLPAGGCNYGNTVVLGQTLLPHLQPSGMAMLALAGDASSVAHSGLPGSGSSHGAADKVAATLDYLQRETGPRTATASLCWAVQGLAAHGRRPADADAWLAAAAAGVRLTAHRAALLLLAALALDGANPLAPPSASMTEAGR